MDDDVPGTDGGARATGADGAGAADERAAREHLLRLGADALAPRPWQEPPVPPSAVDLVRYFLWWSARPGAHGGAHDDAVAEAAHAALRLLPAARAELDQLEVALLFTARGAGLTWDRTAQALGLASRQAGQQRLDRLAARLDRVDDPPPTASRGGDTPPAGHAAGRTRPDEGDRP